MRRIAILASLALVTLWAGASASGDPPAGTGGHPPPVAPAPAPLRHGCHRLFSLGELRAYGRRVYSYRSITRRAQRHVALMIRCQRTAAHERWARDWRRRALAARWGRLHPWRGPVGASWYNDAGTTASGFHAYFGFANKTLAFGTRVEFLYHGRTAVGVMDDHGPYVGGRVFDLNQNLARALGYGGIDAVMYRFR